MRAVWQDTQKGASPSKENGRRIYMRREYRDERKG